MTPSFVHLIFPSGKKYSTGGLQIAKRRAATGGWITKQSLKSFGVEGSGCWEEGIPGEIDEGFQ